jgi:DNA modification methylase
VIFYRKQPLYNPQKWQGEPNHSSKTTERHTRSIYHGAHGRGVNDESGLKYPRSVQRFAKHSSSENLHESQKPVDLCAYLVRTYTDPGETVLDFCMGSGTTGVACVREGRDFVGIEKDTEFGYFDIARERILAEVAKLTEAAAD